MEKTILIYPYTKEYNILIEQLEKADDVKEIRLVSFRGWGYEKEKVKFRNKSISVQTDFESNCRNSEEIWFVNSKFKIDETKLVYPKLRFAYDCGKTIKYYRRINSTVKEILKMPNGSEVTDIPDTLKVISTPIVLTAGLYDYWNEMYVEFALYESIYKKNYRIIYIGSQKYGEAVGMYEFPQFMLDNKYTNRDKILLFNQYIKKLEIEKKPDLIIVGIPGGVSSYSREIVGDFGMLFNLVSVAISVDVFILSISYENYSMQDIYNMRNYVWERYKIYTDYFNIIPKRINSNVSTSLHELRYLTIDDDLVWQKVKELNSKEIYCLDIKSERCRLQEEVFSKLKDFGEIIMI